VIRISVKPKSESAESLAMLGTAIVALDVNSPTERGLPTTDATIPVLNGSIAFKVLMTPHDRYGHIVDPEHHTATTLLHCVHTWNEHGGYVVTVEEG